MDELAAELVLASDRLPGEQLQDLTLAISFLDAHESLCVIIHSIAYSYILINGLSRKNNDGGRMNHGSQRKPGGAGKSSKASGGTEDTIPRAKRTVRLEAEDEAIGNSDFVGDIGGADLFRAGS
jgi:hypothetical protein